MDSADHTGRREWHFSQALRPGFWRREYLMRYRIETDAILTMDDEFRVFRPGQLTWEDGTIVSVGPVADDASPVDQVIHVAGGVLLPGFYNGHNHAAMTLFRGLADDSPIFEWLEQHIWPVEAKLTPDDIYIGTLLAAVEMIKSGTVGYADMYFEMDAVAKATVESGLRGWLSRGLIGQDDGDDDKLNDAIAFASRWKENPLITPMLGPHAPYTCSPKFLERVAESAKTHQLGIHIHLSESLDEVVQVRNQFGVTPIQLAAQTGLFENRALIAHGVHIEPEDIPFLKTIEGGVISCPVSNAKLGNGIMPYNLLQQAGIAVGLGTDGAASTNSLDMFLEMKAMAWMQKVREGKPESFQAQTALMLATRGSARVLGFSGGILESGRPADFIVVDNTAPYMTPDIDTTANLVYAATGNDVLYTIVNGQILLAEGMLTTLDERAIRMEVQNRVARLLSI
ncbi:amidohydrolase family protein [Sulfobacillus thermosulfidooxidans]|uniref:amidohydrolase family protein n=1 Tax=Sulfobacillus thermosulfidooxidans TaxID=28034 RepID=UPI001FA8F0B3|nr:amidohydrolase [Sulfobacillus thermosulfidooxidans]